MLDIVSFAVPFPPNYGGVMDVFYRIEAIVKHYPDVRLHCFTYRDRQPQKMLEALCEVRYYRRSRSLMHHLGRRPFIVESRRDRDLLARLAGSDGPMLFEGLHTCGWIDDPGLAGKIRAVRMHNVESAYYAHLAGTASGLKARHFKVESRKLATFEQNVLGSADVIFPISIQDHAHFKEYHDRVHLVPPFHPYREVRLLEGTGDYVLVHGDLRVLHNLSILDALAPACEQLGLRCVVAGRSPDAEGRRILSNFDNIEILSDVSQEDMQQLLENAQVHVIDAQTTAGFKLKLLTSLFTGRHVIAHDSLLDQHLRKIAHAFNGPSELKELLARLMDVPVKAEDAALRKSVLLPRFSNEQNAQIILQQLGLIA